MKLFIEVYKVPEDNEQILVIHQFSCRTYAWFDVHSLRDKSIPIGCWSAKPKSKYFTY